jgi:hypothetical protein
MAWNQGIDSYLEAMTERSIVIDTPSRFTVLIHPEELHTLVRRLMNLESGTQYDNLAKELASSICFTLGIELI